MSPIYSGEVETAPEEQDISSLGQTSWGKMAANRVAKSLAELPVAKIAGMSELSAASGVPPDLGGLDGAPLAGGYPDDYRRLFTDAPEIGIDEARAKVRAAKLDSVIHLPDRPTMKQGALDIMIDRAQTDQQRDAKIAEGPKGFLSGAFDVGTSLFVSALDPLNITVGMIPIMGEARYGKMLAAAGDSMIGRAGVRTGVGAAKGAMFSTAMTPIDWLANTQEGRDYGMSDALHSILYGAGTFGLMHLAGGAGADLYRSARGRPLYPFGPGEPMENVKGTHVPASLLHEEGITADQLDQHYRGADADAAAIEAPQSWPTQLAASLPPRAVEDLTRTSLAQMIRGEPVTASAVLEAAAKADPRIAESFEVWHGSPHEIERFDSSRIGTGEGAQAYGHGLYFAENEKVATRYARSTSGRDFIRKAQELYSEHDSPNDAHEAIAESKDFTPGQKRLLLALEKDDWLGFDYPHQAVSAALSDPHGKNWEMSPETLEAIKHFGNMYRVLINAHPDHFLDWDKPLAEHPEPVRSKLRAAGFDDAQTGKDIYHSLVKYRSDQGGGTTSAGMKISDLDATPEAASGRLAATGIHGIKYLDQGSRGGAAPEFRSYEEGGQFYVAGREPRQAGPFKSRDEANAWIQDHATRNFIVFDDKHIEITHKNGEPVNREEFNRERTNARAAETGVATAAEQTKAGTVPAQGSRAGEAGNGTGLTAETGQSQLDAWQRLAAARSPEFDPDAVAAAAARLPEPPSLNPSRSLAEAQKLATEAEEIWRQRAEYMPPEEVEAFNRVLEEMDRDHEARMETIRRGAACLAAAFS